MMRSRPVLAVCLVLIMWAGALPSQAVELDRDLGFALETVDLVPAGAREPDAVVGPDGRLWVAYLDNDPRGLKLARGTWKDWQVDDIAPDKKIQYPSIASDGLTVGIAYHEYEGAFLGYTERAADGTWSNTTIDDLGETGGYPSLAFASDGTARVAYYDIDNTALRYARQTPLGVWVPETVVNDAAQGRFAAMILIDDQAHIAFYDTTASKLKVAHETTLGWEVEVVDDTIGSGWFASLTATQTGLLEIAHYNWVRQDLRFSRQQANGTFGTTVLDADDDAGHNLRMFRDASDRPVIVFKDDIPGPATATRMLVEFAPGSWMGATVETSRGGTQFHDRMGLTSPRDGVYDMFYRREADQALRHARVALLAADFVWTPAAGIKGQPVQFTEKAWSAVGPITSYEWDFDGLGSATGRTPQFTFHEIGLYPVTLTVRTADGLEATVTHDVPVGPIPPVAIIDGPSRATKGYPVTFDGTRSYDPDGYIVHYEWHVPGIGRVEGTNFTEILPQGTHTVALTVTDNDGAKDTDLFTIKVQPFVVLRVEMTKNEYSVLEPQDGRVRGILLQGGPAHDMPVRVRVDTSYPLELEDLLNVPVRYRFDLRLDDLGRAEFQVPLTLAHSYLGLPELLALPNDRVVAEYHLVHASARECWLGDDDDFYRVSILPGPDPLNL